MQYVKYNKVMVKQGKRDDSTKAILDFLKGIETQESKMKGFIVMDSLEDPSESIVLTFWESREDMDKFYQPENHLLSDLVEKLKPSFEILPERRDYKVLTLKSDFHKIDNTFCIEETKY
ncbi:antibiotic biosynthesis monooxygenase family protein [Candidatus Nitrosocosmicus sp. T]